MVVASKFTPPMVPYSVKNTFVDVTPAQKRPARSSSAPPVARFTQASVASPPRGGPLAPFDYLASAAEPSEGTPFSERDQVDRMSRKTILEMQILTKKLNLKTSRWIRVVHSGYGAAKWEEALRSSAVAWVAASKTAEGFYVHVPTKLGKDGICQALKQINSAVRRDTYFPDMKRSNKSRLQFKEEIVVTASGTLVQEDASTSAGSEYGSAVEHSASDIDAAEQFLAPSSPGAACAERFPAATKPPDYGLQGACFPQPGLYPPPPPPPNFMLVPTSALHAAPAPFAPWGPAALPFLCHSLDTR